MIPVTLNIVGTRALLMHSDKLADPLAPLTKEFKRVSGKRVKTDADHEEMARMEFLAGLYYEGGQVVIPAPNINRCLIDGARITKSGAKVERGVVINGTDFPLIYDGPTDPEDLYRDKNFVSRMSVKVGQARTMRCRPRFRQWALTVPVFMDEALLNIGEFQDIATNAGNMIGLGDYRKGGGFGRFTATVVVD